MLHGLDANLLHYLLALLEENTVERAARRVGLSQSGMSRALARLRDHFSDPLFVANGRGLRPTPFAASLTVPLRTALQALGGVSELRAAFDPLRSARIFRIASADYSTRLLLAPLAAVLRERAPQLTLQITAMSDDLLELVDSGVHLLIGPPLRGRLRARSKLLYTEDFCLVARPDHPLLRGELTPERYARATHVLVSPGGKPGSLMGDSLRTAGLERRIAVTVPSFLCVPDFLNGSDLVATLPRQLAKLLTASGELALRELPLTSPRFPVTMSFPAEYERDPAHRWLRERLVEVADRYRGRVGKRVARTG